MLSKTEKEQRVIELYKQGKNIREIAREVHMSFADIGKQSGTLRQSTCTIPFNGGIFNDLLAYTFIHSHEFCLGSKIGYRIVWTSIS